MLRTFLDVGLVFFFVMLHYVGVVFLMFFFLFGLLFFILFPHFNLEVVVIAMMVSGLGYVVVAWLMGLICGMC